MNDTNFCSSSVHVEVILKYLCTAVGCNGAPNRYYSGRFAGYDKKSPQHNGTAAPREQNAVDIATGGGETSLLLHSNAVYKDFSYVNMYVL